MLYITEKKLFALFILIYLFYYMLSFYANTLWKFYYIIVNHDTYNALCRALQRNFTLGNCRREFTGKFILLDYGNVLCNVIPMYLRRTILVTDPSLALSSRYSTTLSTPSIFFSLQLVLFHSALDTVVSQRWRKIDRTTNWFCQSR